MHDDMTLHRCDMGAEATEIHKLHQPPCCIASMTVPRMNTRQLPNHRVGLAVTNSILHMLGNSLRGRQAITPQQQMPQCLQRCTRYTRSTWTIETLAPPASARLLFRNTQWIEHDCEPGAMPHSNLTSLCQKCYGWVGRWVARWVVGG